MSDSIIYFAGGRHAPKKKIPVVYGSEDDRALPLSPEGEEAIRKIASRFAQGVQRRFDFVFSLDSHYVREQKTRQIFVKTVTGKDTVLLDDLEPNFPGWYNLVMHDSPNGKIALFTNRYGHTVLSKENNSIIETDNRLCYSSDIDWLHKSVPIDKKHDYLANLVKQFYFPQDNGPILNMAKEGFNFFSALIDGISNFQDYESGGISLFTMFSHRPTIDFMDIIRYAHPNAGKREVVINSRYNGEFKNDELITGQIYNIKSDSPILDLKVKGTNWLYSLDDLKWERDRMYDHWQIT